MILDPARLQKSYAKNSSTLLITLTIIIGIYTYTTTTTIHIHYATQI